MNTAGVAALALSLAVTAACGRSSEVPSADEAAGDARTTVPMAPPAHESATTVTLAPAAAPSPTAARGAAASEPAADAARRSTTTTLVPNSPDTFTPAAGRYVYEAAGTTTTPGPVGGTEESSTPQEDRVAVTQEGGSTVLTVTTRTGDETQETEFVIDAGAVVLRRLTYTSTTSQTVRPVPAVPVSALPYERGKPREFAWRDDSAGIQGVGASEVEAFETIATPAGTFDCAVLRVRQRIRGAATGAIDLTLWVDRGTGTQAKRRVVSSFDGPSGTTTTDVTATLRSIG